MAIKGKSKAKSRPRPVARAPRHEPVVVKPPFPMRRWVQVTAALVAGILIATFAIYTVTRVRNERRDSAAAAAADKAGANKRSAGLAWQSQVEGAASRLGTVSPSVTPVVFKSMNAAIDQMVKKGTVPGPAENIFRAGAHSAEKAVNSLQNFDLAGTISNKGFDVAEAEYFTESRDRLVAAITSYQRAAEAAILAAQAHGTPHFKELTALADHLRSDANTQFQTAWSTYESALGAAGIAPKPPSTGIGGG